MAYSWNLPDNDTNFESWPDYYNPVLGALLATHQGPDDPSAGASAHAVPGTRWDDTNVGEDKCRARLKDNTDWYIVHDLDVDYGGLLHRGGAYPMLGDFDLDGHGIVLDEDGDLKLVGSRDGAVSDDQLVLRLATTDLLVIDAAAATKLLDLKGQLRLANPEGFSAAAPSAATCKAPIQTSAGTKYLMLADS